MCALTARYVPGPMLGAGQTGMPQTVSEANYISFQIRNNNL